MTFPPETVERVARAIMIARDNGGCIVKDWEKEAEYNPHVAQALRQATAALTAAWEWRPIEEVPKDGTEILLFDGADMWSDKWDDDFKDWDVSPFSEPTHWIPLPTPPADVKGEVG